MCCCLVLLLQIEGRENLPPASTPAVYVANHQSFMVGGPMQQLIGCFTLLSHLNHKTQRANMLGQL